MIVQLQFDLPGIEKVHLKIVVVAMGLHIAAKKGRHPAKGLIMHIVRPQTLVVLFTDIDIGNRALAHNRSSVDLLRRHPRRTFTALLPRHRDPRQHQRTQYQQPGHKPQPGAEAAGCVAQNADQ